eukprot:SAG31_NODE_46556_length_254_cov_0.651613_1_plen_41_part_01
MYACMYGLFERACLAPLDNIFLTAAANGSGAETVAEKVKNA